MPEQRRVLDADRHHFRNYNERLLFAGTNEVHADFGTPTAEHITVQQSYNQTFVTAVRATGGNNASRSLVVQTYNTNIRHGLDFFSLPTDSDREPADRRSAPLRPVRLHAESERQLQFLGSALSRLGRQVQLGVGELGRHQFAKVRAKWVDQGVPVIIGEYGVATRPGKNLEARAYWHEYINRAAARERHQDVLLGQRRPPPRPTTFALFDRNTGPSSTSGARRHPARLGRRQPGVMYTLTTQ